MRIVRRKTIITDFCCIFDGALPEIDTDQEEVRKDSSNLGVSLRDMVVETCIFLGISSCDKLQIDMKSPQHKQKK